MENCDPEIFRNGHGLAVVYGEPADVERWVRELAESAATRIDWFVVGPYKSVVHLGDEASCQRARGETQRLAGRLVGQIVGFPGCSTAKARAATPPAERPWCGAPKGLGGQQPCPIRVPCDARTCRLGAAADDETYRPDPI